MKTVPSLRARLIAGVLFATVLVWSVLAASGYFESRRQLEELMDANLEQTAELLAAQLTEEDDRDEIELEHVRQLHRYGRRVAFQVWERGTRLRLRSSSAPNRRLSPATSGFTTNPVDGQTWRVFSTWAGAHQALVQVGEPVSARQRVSLEITEHLLAPVAIALPLLALALLMAIRNGLKPLDLLAKQLADMDPTRLQPVRAASAPREVRPLVAQLNQLFERIGHSLEKERRFTADAAHELRTPMAAIAVQAQVAQGATAPGERERAISKVLEACQRGTHLVDQLLTLARADSASRIESEAPCDLVRLAREVLADMVPVSQWRGVQLELEGPSSLMVSGNETWLRILLRNLVDNAIRYGHPGGYVQVRLSSGADGTLLEVCDDGPGIPEEDRARVFERFYRIAGSGESGSGLGLSIVSRIVQTCGARLALDEGVSGKGLHVRLFFPKGPPPDMT